jgi:RNA polymerase sigma-70 factor (ECF subfamily)
MPSRTAPAPATHAIVMPMPPRSSDALPRAALAYVDGLYRLAVRLTGDRVAAQDLVQETFSRALAGAASFAPGSNLRAWLFRILRNTQIDAERRARVTPIQPSVDDDADEGAAAGPGQPPGQLGRLVSRDVEAALSSLSTDARTVVLLDLEGWSEAELAEVLGCAPGTVKLRLSRARAALRLRLRDYAR